MRTVAVALMGAGVAGICARTARRAAVVDRLPRARRRGAPARVPRPLERRVAVALDGAALGVPVLHALQLWAAAAGSAAIVGFAVAGPAAAIGAGVLVAAGVPAALVSQRGRRSRLVAGAVAPAIERVASELRAGGTIATAIAGVARGDGPLAADFARIDARVRLGASVTDALAAWARERPLPGVALAAGAFSLCATVGGRCADALDGLAASLRDRRGVAAEARALSTQARGSAVVIGATPLLYLAWSVLVDRRAVDAVFATATGRVCLAVGLALECLGAWWMHRIVKAGSVL